MVRKWERESGPGAAAVSCLTFTLAEVGGGGADVRGSRTLGHCFSIVTKAGHQRTLPTRLLDSPFVP